MSEEVAIRLPQPSDAAALIELMVRLQQQSDTFTVADDLASLSIAQERAQLEQIEQSPQHLLLVASLADQLIGVVSIVPTATENEGELGVAVDQPYWHQGLGTALVDEALYWAHHASTLAVVGLEVQTRNVAAIRLYEKLGFETTTAPTHSVITASGATEPAIKMHVACQS